MPHHQVWTSLHTTLLDGHTHKFNGPELAMDFVEKKSKRAVNPHAFQWD